MEGQISIFDYLEEKIETPILVKPGQKIWIVYRAEVEEHIVEKRTWDIQKTDRGYDVDHDIIWNSGYNKIWFINKLKAEVQAERNAADYEIMYAKDMEAEKVVAYTYEYYQRTVINFYAWLKNGLLYMHAHGQFAHITKPNMTDFDISEYNRMMKCKEQNHKITILEDYKPEFCNMYKLSGKDKTWMYAEAHYQHFNIL